MYSVCIAFFFAGLFLTIIFFIIAASNLGDHDSADGETDATETESETGETTSEMDHEIHSGTEVLDHSIETDVHGVIDGGTIDDMNSDTTSDMEFHAIHLSVGDSHDVTDTMEHSELDTGVSTGVSTSLSTEISGENSLLTFENHTPFTLIFSLYLLWFGLIGLITYEGIVEKIFWLIIIIIVPIGITKLISLIWRRIAKNIMYRVEQGQELIGKPATVKVEITQSGGSISFIKDYLVHQLPAKSLYPLSKYNFGELVYICDFKDGWYLVDGSANSIKKSRLRAQTLSNKETTSG